VDQLGPNALGEVLEPGRVPDCYLGLLLPPGPAGEPEAGTSLIVAPAALLHPRVPQPAGRLIYELLSGHPEREAGELVLVADLTGELRAWPTDTWTKVGIDPDQVAQAVVGCWRDGEVPGLQVDDLSFEEARSLVRLADNLRWHWAIENGLHHVRDITFAEDASRVRTGTGPTSWPACATAPSARCAAPSRSISPLPSVTTPATPPDPSHPRDRPRMNRTLRENAGALPPPVSGLKDVLLLDWYPGQLLPPARELVAAAHV
jgi:hypothetical protein